MNKQNDVKGRLTMIPIHLEIMDKLLTEGEVGSRLEEFQNDEDIAEIISSQFIVFKRFLKKMEHKYHISEIVYTKSDFEKEIWESLKYNLIFESVNLAALENCTISESMIRLLKKELIVFSIKNIVNFLMLSYDEQISSKLVICPNIVMRSEIVQ